MSENLRTYFNIHSNPRLMNTETKEQLNECDFCNSEEEKICPIGGFKVRLEAVYLGGSKILVCQSCMHEHFRVEPSYHTNGQSKMSRFAFWKKLPGSKAANQSPVFR